MHDHFDVSEDDLITAAQHGDHGAFMELCRRHSAVTKRKIFSIVRSSEDAEDALQETLLRAFTHLSSFRRSCRFSTWLTTIGVNSALMIVRKRRTRGEARVNSAGSDAEVREIEPIDRSPGPETAFLKKQVVLLVGREVEKLQPSLREVIKHYYETECSLKEAAGIHGISVAALKSRLLRGRGRLRSSLAKYGASGLRS